MYISYPSEVLDMFVYWAALMRSAAFSATPYKVLCKWALRCRGNIEASTTRTFVVLYTTNWALTTPILTGSQAHDEVVKS